jgi:hypothetical protein
MWNILKLPVTYGTGYSMFVITSVQDGQNAISFFMLLFCARILVIIIGNTIFLGMVLLILTKA